jgi:hypothetical protein
MALLRHRKMRMDFRFRRKSGRATDIMTMTEIDMRERLTVGSMDGLGRVERTDGDVVRRKLIV